MDFTSFPAAGAAQELTHSVTIHLYGAGFPACRPKGKPESLPHIIGKPVPARKPALSPERTAELAGAE
jgi:hypothetical protein